jgi:hypothetical protein
MAATARTGRMRRLWWRQPNCKVGVMAVSPLQLRGLSDATRDNRIMYWFCVVLQGDINMNPRLSC